VPSSLSPVVKEAGSTRTGCFCIILGRPFFLSGAGGHDFLPSSPLFPLPNATAFPKSLCRLIPNPQTKPPVRCGNTFVFPSTPHTEPSPHPNSTEVELSLFLIARPFLGTSSLTFCLQALFGPLLFDAQARPFHPSIPTPRK